MLPGGTTRRIYTKHKREASSGLQAMGPSSTCRRYVRPEHDGWERCVEVEKRLGPREVWFGRLTSCRRRVWAVTYHTPRLAEGFIPPKDGSVVIRVDILPSYQRIPQALATAPRQHSHVQPAQNIVAPNGVPFRHQQSGPAPNHVVQHPEPIVQGRVLGRAASESTQDHDAAADDDDSEDDDEYIEEVIPNAWPAPEVPESVFRSGAFITPEVAALKGSLLNNIVLGNANISTLAKMGLVKSTRDLHARLLHARLLRKYKDLLTESNGPLPTAIIVALMRERSARKWQWSTTLKYLASLQGAFALLPLYAHTAIVVQLKTSPEWRQALRAATKQAREEIGYEPKSLTCAMMESAVRHATGLELRSLLGLAWATCGRVGCCLQLKKEDVHLGAEGAVAITFRRGKGVLFRGPYTVHSRVPDFLVPAVFSLLQQRESFLFKQQDLGKQLLHALRFVDPQLEQRSIRRGAAQALARTGLSEEMLMHFTGHTKVATLRRYLGWGRESHATARAAIPAAQEALNF